MKWTSSRILLATAVGLMLALASVGETKAQEAAQGQQIWCMDCYGGGGVPTYCNLSNYHNYGWMICHADGESSCTMSMLCECYMLPGGGSPPGGGEPCGDGFAMGSVQLPDGSQWYAGQSEYVEAGTGIRDCQGRIVAGATRSVRIVDSHEHRINITV